MARNIDGINWTKSSRCDSGACVEIAFTSHGVLMRDSKDTTEGEPLAFSEEAWRAFMAGLVAGEFVS